ncbi:Oligopeptide ABC transporter, periplasmic oligopeptide-binding protein OppA [Leifsonia rubra CMS 76R]|nr:Oligopeptide ABC transporter, periplasmic oligopeptide-binding protein OppA [Leifsonia rubra CMS 76R]
MTSLKPRAQWRWLTAIAAAGTVLLASGCSPAAPVSSGPQVLNVAASAGITTWDPIASFSTEALYMGNFYEPLLWANPAGSDEPFTPALAESWETSEDGLSWTFTIREGVTFHDGEELNAAAVKGSLDAAAERAGASFIWAPVDNIETPDEFTVVINLAYPAPVDLIAASTYGAWIVSPAALDAAADDETYFESGVEAGTGPYSLKSYTPGSEVVLEKFDGYWNDERASHYDIVDVAITPDAVTAQQMLSAGEVDLSTAIPLETVADLVDDPDFTVADYNSPFSFLAMFNTTRAPLDNVTVRQALSYAIPYDDIITVGGQGYGTQSHGPVPRGIFPFSEDVPQYEYDLEKAADLLEQAGHPGGGFSLNLSYASENLSEARFVTLIKDSFAKVGVEVNIKAELFNQQWETAKADPATAQDIFILYYWPTYSDAGSDNMWSLFHSSEKPFFNLSYWNNAEYDFLVEEAGSLAGTDKDAAAATYQDAMDILYDEAPAAFLYDVRAVSVVPTGLEVQGFNENYPFTTFFNFIRPAA